MAEQTHPSKEQPAQPHKVTWEQVFKEIDLLREDLRDFKEATRHDTEKTR